MPVREKILIGLSGGVDSALCAALLVEAGHEVHGVYLKAWSEADTLPMTSCPWKDDIADARRVAAHLGIPFTVIDVHEAYRARVVDVMLAEYAAGRTPNPDILCNREMKFGLLLDLARELNYDAVTTGHYAQVINGQLHRGIDLKKDQTYFLWTLRPEQLSVIRFPIGHLTKPEVRAEAKRRNLPVAQKKDSQGICFLGPVEVHEFLRASLNTKPGNVVNTSGQVIGTHDGAATYTIGQRHGFKLSVAARQTPVHYVVAKDVMSNQIMVDDTPPMTTTLTASEPNWLEDPPAMGDRLEARIRHGQEPQPAAVETINYLPRRQAGQLQTITLKFEQAQTSIAPGQSVVFSTGSRILGGGLIV